MFSKNLKYYRLKKQLSKKALADKIHVSAMAITNYEDGSRYPNNMEILSALAAALDVRVSDFLTVRNEHLVFQHAEFRKNASLSKMQQEYVKESVEEYLGRFMTAVEILGGEVLPDAPACHILSLSNDNEDLGGGYTYYSEQKMISGKFQIPPTIQEYKYDSEIIIAKQHPTKHKDIMYADYNYPFGRDTIYYWIIDKKANTFSGPMNHNDFLKEISQYDDKFELN